MEVAYRGFDELELVVLANELSQHLPRVLSFGDPLSGAVGEVDPVFCQPHLESDQEAGDTATVGLWSCLPGTARLVLARGQEVAFLLTGERSDIPSEGRLLRVEGNGRGHAATAPVSASMSSLSSRDNIESHIGPKSAY